MKKIFTLFALLPFTTAAFGQITITSTDIPVPGTFNCVDITSTAAPNPTMSTGGTWDYSSYTSSSTFTNVYTPETLSVFTAAGANVFLAGTKTLTTGFVYYTNSELAFTSSGVKEVGINVPAQAYDLSSFTFSTSDSLIIPSQQIVLTTPKVTMQFPMTAGTHWTSNTRRAVNFTLSVAAASLSHAPGQHVYYSFRSDTIAGWGNLRVHTSSGPSMLYNVLVDKIAQYNVDSFYLGGAPASATLLSSFGVTQGQTTDSNYRYNFYRKGSYNYLESFYYGGDNTWSTPRGKYQNTDSLTPATAGINEVNNVTYTSVVFPNPASNAINVLFSGKDIHAKNYIITDMTGKAVQAGQLTAQNNVHIDLNSTLANGSYMLDIWDEAGAKVASEKLTIIK